MGRTSLVFAGLLPALLIASPAPRDSLDSTSSLGLQDADSTWQAKSNVDQPSLQDPSVQALKNDPVVEDVLSSEPVKEYLQNSGQNEGEDLEETFEEVRDQAKKSDAVPGEAKVAGLLVDLMNIADESGNDESQQHTKKSADESTQESLRKRELAAGDFDDFGSGTRATNGYHGSPYAAKDHYMNFDDTDAAEDWRIGSAKPNRAGSLDYGDPSSGLYANKYKGSGRKSYGDVFPYQQAGGVLNGLGDSISDKRPLVSTATKSVSQSLSSVRGNLAPEGIEQEVWEQLHKVTKVLIHSLLFSITGSVAVGTYAATTYAQTKSKNPAVAMAASGIASNAGHTLGEWLKRIVARNAGKMDKSVDRALVVLTEMCKKSPKARKALTDKAERKKSKAETRKQRKEEKKRLKEEKKAKKQAEDAEAKGEKESKKKSKKSGAKKSRKN